MPNGLDPPIALIADFKTMLEHLKEALHFPLLLVRRFTALLTLPVNIRSLILLDISSI